MNNPLISVIIPAYNGELYLQEAIQSVLNQTYSHHEILVIDNGSQDRTGQIAQSFPNIRYIYSEKANTALARHRGVELSEGAYIAFLDQDDLWMPSKSMKQVEFLEANPQYGAIIGLQQLFLQPGSKKPHWLKQAFLETPQQGYLPSALMVRRSTFQVTDNFNTAFPLASDVAWFFKAKHEGVLVGNIEEIVIRRRIHPTNASNHLEEVQKDLLASIKDSLLQRRKG